MGNRLTPTNQATGQVKEKEKKKACSANVKKHDIKIGTTDGTITRKAKQKANVKAIKDVKVKEKEKGNYILMG